MVRWGTDLWLAFGVWKPNFLRFVWACSTLRLVRGASVWFVMSTVRPMALSSRCCCCGGVLLLLLCGFTDARERERERPLNAKQVRHNNCRKVKQNKTNKHNQPTNRRFATKRKRNNRKGTRQTERERGVCVDLSGNRQIHPSIPPRQDRTGEERSGNVGLGRPSIDPPIHLFWRVTSISFGSLQRRQ